MQNYAAYNDEGEGVSHDLESVVTSRSIPSNGRLVVTVTGNSVTFTGDVEKATYYSASEPALLKKTLAKDETFIVVNTSSQSETIQYVGGAKKKFSYPIFNSDGSVSKQAVDTAPSQPYKVNVCYPPSVHCDRPFHMPLFTFPRCSRSRTVALFSSISPCCYRLDRTMRYVSYIIVEIQQPYAKTDVILGIEPTGHYWFPLAEFLHRENIKMVIVNPHHVNKSKKREDNSPTKNDYKDARLIADLFRNGKYSEPTLPTSVYADLHILMNLREKVMVNFRDLWSMNSSEKAPMLRAPFHDESFFTKR